MKALDVTRLRESIDSEFTGECHLSSDDARELIDSYWAALQLLARIHRDGGHYVEHNGMAKAFVDAETRMVRLLSVRDAAESVRDDYDDSELFTLPMSTRCLFAAVDAARKAGT